ncbi:cold-shock protein [Eionea flava]
MKGAIKFFKVDEGYGFIISNDKEHFFHRNSLSYGIEEDISSGTWVSFEITDGKKGPEASNITLFDPDEYNPTAILESISEWKLDAKHDEMNRYFYHVDQGKDIEAGKKTFVIGRKGSGKTALSEHISLQRDPKVFTQKLTFKNFPFNNLYSLENKDYTRPNQYISLWKYLIYSSICKMMITNEAIDIEVRSVLSELFGTEMPLKNLKRSIKKWTAKEFSLKLMGAGGKIGIEKSEQSWIERLDILEEIIEEYIDDSQYFVVFDELDEDYKNIVELGQQTDYISLVTSLFKAVQDVRSIFSDASAKLRPVVFLRDDIYDLILDPDKNKWEDFRVDLEWNVDRIKKLLAFRISKAIGQDQELLGFDEAWDIIFSDIPVRMGARSKKRMPIFEYITRSTHLRPRDYVRYLQVSAKDTIEDRGDTISPETVKRVDKGFSNYLRNELVDEIHGILPDIQEIFGIISEIRKWAFTIDEFKEIYSDRLEKGILTTKDSDFALKILFHFSVIGNQPRNGLEFFRYKNKEARFNFKENIVVHRGLFKSLQII